MRYRKLDANGDYSFGQSANDFWIDVPDAPAQAVETRLRLLAGEWFLDDKDGTPYSTQILGKNTLSTYDIAFQERILGTQGVTGISEYSSQLNTDTRGLTVNATINTVYGSTTATASF